MQNEYSKEVRFIACYNSDVARKNKITRERNIKKFEKLFEKNEKRDSLRIKRSLPSVKEFFIKVSYDKIL